MQQPLARPPVGFAVFEDGEAARAWRDAGWLEQQQAAAAAEPELTPGCAGAPIQ